MLSNKRIISLFLCCIILVSFASVAFAQTDSGKKVLSIDDYEMWRTIGNSSISDNGDWISFSYIYQERDDTLYVKSTVSDIIYTIPRGNRPVFSDDSKWVAYYVNLPDKEQEKLREAKKPVTTKAELMNLETEEKLTWVNVSSFSYAKGSGYIAVKKIKADPESKLKGSDLLLRNLNKGYHELIGQVNEFSFNKPGTLFMYTIDASDKNGNGLYLIDLSTNVREPLDNGDMDYSRMTWNEKGNAIAVLKGKEKEGFLHNENLLVAVTGLDGQNTVKTEYDPSEASDFPKDHVISEKGDVVWRESLNKVFFGIIKQETKPDKSKTDSVEVADVDIWHWNDARIQSVQMASETRDKNFTYTGVLNLDNNKFFRLTDKKMRYIDLTMDGNWGIGRDDTEYQSDWKDILSDYYRINTDTGERNLIMQAQNISMGVSPDSRSLLYWKDSKVWKYDIPTDKKINLTEKSPVNFVNMEFDYAREKPSYGVAGWTLDKSAVILNHRYDLWLQPLDGSAPTNLTEGYGDKNEIRLRYVRLDTEEKFIDLSKPVLLSVYGQWTKKSGFVRLVDKKVQPLILEDKSFGRAVKAQKADKLLYTIQSFRDYPDYYVSEQTFADPKRVTEANPQQSEFKWGRRILFDYTNKGGVRLQGTLAVPDGYEEGQKLPMLVNFYEKNSQNLHRHIAPRYTSSFGSVSMEAVSKGYLYMQPDIHFNISSSHSDMLDCVEAAVKKVIEMGYADPERIGLNGHSYSGEGASYIATQSDMFAAVASGAGVTNLVADYNHFWGWNYQLRGRNGANGHQYYNNGQGRWGTNPHDDFETYWNESAVAHAKTMNVPLLLLHGTDDPTVAFMESLEFYNALRFNGKNVILLAYPGEVHSLRKLPNRKDLTVRMMQFFDHYLMDKEAPDWMKFGVPYIEKKK
ncbi:alpha/beta hydrolase family protein [candidate division KSB1 bacterium]